MSSRRLPFARPPRLTPLAACFAALLGATDASATLARPNGAVVVSNCLNSGAGSLRQAVLDSQSSNNPIDLTHLSCSLITLTTGRIDVSRDILLQGPGSGLLTIDGNNNDRIFNQNSTHVLAVYGMTLQRGYSDAFGGGCIYSSGPLQLNDTVITGCKVFDIASSGSYKGGGVLVNGTLTAIGSAIVDNEIYSSLGYAFGGGASVTGDAVLASSTISGNHISNASGGLTQGGGISITGKLTMMYSTISNNSVSGLSPGQGRAAGARVLGGAAITNSTISGNTADGGIGGLEIHGSAASPTTIVNSTISSNVAGAVGGIYASGPTTIANSTIAFNTETAFANGAGLRVTNSFANIQSSIVAGNTSFGTTQNIGLGISGGVSGANDLIGASPSVSLPAGTIGGNPKLLALANNGGPTKTHALGPGSPAINAGNNSTTPLSTDQRGPGFVRVVGAAPDIGAFEGVDTDSIFRNGFD
ncbi:MAG: choice-of-anchor Q domain-containing protein [Dokdonella sp.]